MILSYTDIVELQTIWDENLDIDGRDFNKIAHRVEYYKKVKEGKIKKFYKNSKSGHMLLATKCAPLEEWYRNKFDIASKFPLGGQLALFYEPLGVHADVLFYITDHFSTKVHTTTRYAVLKTNCTDMLHTYIFDQYVDRTKWRGLEHFKEVSNIDETIITGLINTPIKGHEGLDHLSEISESLGLTVKEKIPLPTGKIISWPSHYLHSGQSFVSAGGSWKFHITILTPTNAIKNNKEQINDR